LLPLPISHRQPPSDDLDDNDSAQIFVTEPFWTQLLPLSSTVQYILSWYAAETVPKEIEDLLSATETITADGKRRYVPSPLYPKTLRIAERIQMDGLPDSAGMYEPIRYAGTGVDAEEALYESYLLPIAEARKKLRGSVMEDVVRRAWDAVEERRKIELGATIR